MTTVSTASSLAKEARGFSTAGTDRASSNGGSRKNYHNYSQSTTVADRVCALE